MQLFEGRGKLIDVRVMNGYGFVEFENAAVSYLFRLALTDVPRTPRMSSVNSTARSSLAISVFMSDRTDRALMSSLIVEAAKESRRREQFDGYVMLHTSDMSLADKILSPGGYPPRGPPPRRGARITVLGVPSGTSWQVRINPRLLGFRIGLGE